MCGIAGLIALSSTPSGSLSERASSMVARLAHRGPDDTGTWESPDGTVGLAQRRLAVIDLSPLGHNPMSWDGGRLWITFNGEIYNFQELRQELIAAGHRFRSQSDTEVILAAYDQWGIDAVHRLVGMFAFALWDSGARRLWLVRDRLGKKPLYYADFGGLLRFGSELKAILDDEALPREVDAVSVRQYLRYGYVPSPRTIYTHIRKLPPAHHLLCEQGRVVVQRYWNPLVAASRRDARPEPEVMADLEATLTRAVQQRMIADVPLGAFLSGGIDSSLVVALMQEHSPRPVQTFTVRFDDAEYDEADHAAAVARHLGTEHHEQPCREADMLDVVHRLPSMFDEPFADSSAIPTYLVSKAARSAVIVALSGDGGDELFLGYQRYVHYADTQWLLRQPAPLRRAAAALASRLPTRRLRRIADILRLDDADLYARFVAWWSSGEIETATGAPADEAQLYREIADAAPELDHATRAGLLDLVSYLPEDILTKVDRASMAVSLEVRAPLLDHRVVELALALPPRMKRDGRSTKVALRRMLESRVPKALTDRPKMGFGVPLERWMRGPLRDRMDRACRGPELDALLVNPAPARRLWSDFLQGRSRRADQVWQLFVLLAWAGHR